METQGKFGTPVKVDYPNMTEVQLVRYVYDFLINQGVPAAYFSEDDQAEPKCAYEIRRNGSLRKCAAGCLLPTGLTDEEGNSPSGFWPQVVDQFDLPTDHFNLIQRLQKAHDTAATDYQRGVAWEAAFRNRLFQHISDKLLYEVFGEETLNELDS